MTQLPGKCIRPGVVGTDDVVGVTAAFKQLMGAVPADVIEPAQCFVLAANDENTLVGNAGSQVVTGFA